MIELFLNIIVGFLFLVIIWFLIQYGLKFRQERLRQEDHRNSILKEEQRINEREQERLRRELQVKEQEQKEKEHKNKLASGYKYYEWRGIITWIHKDKWHLCELYRTTETKSGKGYFKSEEDLRDYLNAEHIVLKWSREL
jgi:hypothetical protein